MERHLNKTNSKENIQKGRSMKQEENETYIVEFR